MARAQLLWKGVVPTLDGSYRLGVSVVGPDSGAVDTKPTLVFVHPYTIMGGSSGNEIGKAALLAERGYACVVFDMRGAGDSGGSASFFFSDEVDDVCAVLDWVRR